MANMNFDTTALWKERYRKLEKLASSKQSEAGTLTHLSKKQEESHAAAKAAERRKEVTTKMRDLNMQVGGLRLENEEVVRQVTDAVNECNEQRAQYDQVKARREALDRELGHAKKFPLLEAEIAARRDSLHSIDDKAIGAIRGDAQRGR